MSNLCINIYLGTWKGMEITQRVSIHYNNIIVYCRGSRDFGKIPYTPKTRRHDNMIKIKMYTSSCIHIHTYINVGII